MVGECGLAIMGNRARAVGRGPRAGCGHVNNSAFPLKAIRGHWGRFEEEPERTGSAFSLKRAVVWTVGWRAVHVVTGGKLEGFLRVWVIGAAAERERVGGFKR